MKCVLSQPRTGGAGGGNYLTINGYSPAGGGNYLRELKRDNGSTLRNVEFFNVLDNPKIASTFREQDITFTE